MKRYLCLLLAILASCIMFASCVPTKKEVISLNSCEAIPDLPGKYFGIKDDLVKNEEICIVTKDEKSNEYCLKGGLNRTIRFMKLHGNIYLMQTPGFDGKSYLLKLYQIRKDCVGSLTKSSIDEEGNLLKSYGLVLGKDGFLAGDKRNIVKYFREIARSLSVNSSNFETKWVRYGSAIYEYMVSHAAEIQRYKLAEKQNKAEDIKKYLAEYPNGIFKAKALARLRGVSNYSLSNATMIQQGFEEERRKRAAKRARLELERRRLAEQARLASDRSDNGLRSNKPHLFILSIGVSRYRDSSLNLKFAAKDAEDFASVLQNQSPRIFARIHTKVMKNEQVTRDSVLNALQRFLGQAVSSDMAVIFLAGHGVKRANTGSYYFLPHQVNSGNLFFMGLRWSDFQEEILVLKKRISRVIVVLDTCHAGAMQLSMRGIARTQDLSAGLKSRGIFTLAATQPGEQAEESDLLAHGAFTYALLEGLNGQADYDGNRVVDVTELFHYVERRVPKLTNGKQHPHFKMDGSTLPIIALHR